MLSRLSKRRGKKLRYAHRLLVRWCTGGMVQASSGVSTDIEVLSPAITMFLESWASMGGARMLKTVRCHRRSPRIVSRTRTLRSCFSKENRSSTYDVNSGMRAFSSPWIPMGNGFRWGIKRQSIVWTPLLVVAKRQQRQFSKQKWRLFHSNKSHIFKHFEWSRRVESNHRPAVYEAPPK